MMVDEPRKRRERPILGGGKRRNRSKRRDQRRADAIARQVEYDALSIEEKLMTAGKKETAKLKKKEKS